MQHSDSAKKSSGILTWPEGERPRERLLRSGPHSLTDAELVAILLRIGVRGTSAVELARHILKKFGSLRAVAEAPLSEDLYAALKPIRVQFLDHVVVAGDSVFSFADSGLMDEIALAKATG
jgi:DNA repair protein RadC